MQRNITIILVASMAWACGNGQSKISNAKQNPKTETSTKNTAHAVDSSWVEITEEEYGVILDLRYATPNNFTKEKIYDCPKCYLRKEPAAALKKVCQGIVRKDVKLKIFDAYRPLQYQQKMYDIVQNPNYVALPSKGSMHNKGLALDLTLVDKTGPMDMGTSFDDFSEKARFGYEGLSEEQKRNRTILRRLMTDAGFSSYDKEWWHFSYKKVDYPLDSFVWSCD